MSIERYSHCAHHGTTPAITPHALVGIYLIADKFLQVNEGPESHETLALFILPHLQGTVVPSNIPVITPRAPMNSKNAVLYCRFMCSESEAVNGNNVRRLTGKIYVIWFYCLLRQYFYVK